MTFRTQIGYFVLLTAALAAPCMEWSFDGKEPLRSDGQALCQSDVIAVLFVLR